MTPSTPTRRSPIAPQCHYTSRLVLVVQWPHEAEFLVRNSQYVCQIALFWGGLCAIQKTKKNHTLITMANFFFPANKQDSNKHPHQQTPSLSNTKISQKYKRPYSPSPLRHSPSPLRTNINIESGTSSSRPSFFEAVVCFAYAAYSDGVGD